MCGRVRDASAYTSKYFSLPLSFCATQSGLARSIFGAWKLELRIKDKERRSERMRRALIRYTFIQSGSVFERTMHKRGVASFSRKSHALRPPRTIGACCVFSGTKKDYYQILGLPRSATKPELKKKYFELAKKFHPVCRAFAALIDIVPTQTIFVGCK